jgi:hypothetical protein
MPRHRNAAAAVEPAAVEPGPVEAPVDPQPVVSSEPAPQVSTVADVLRLKHDYESKREAAIQELLKKRTEIEKQFNADLAEIEHQLQELGHVREPEWVPVPASKVQPFRKAKAKSKSATEKFCPICTVDPEKPVLGHDGRKHKGQKRKRPFTAAELKAYEGR